MEQDKEMVTDRYDASKELDTKLSIENMLLEEYKYASTAAYQAIEDRARVINLYYILIGILATGLAAIYQFSGPYHAYSQLLAILLLLVASGLSFTFFINIIRLRQAFLESIICMNLIKEFYIQQFQRQMPGIEQVFRWRLKTVPAAERTGSVTFVMSYLIASVGSLCFATAVALAIMQLSHDLNIISVLSLSVAVVVFSIVLLLYTLYYHHSLSPHSEGSIQLEQAKQAFEREKITSTNE